MPQIKENFFENILFRFESCSCDCVEDIEHVTPGEEPISKFKLQAMPEHPILFGYAAKDGLVRIAPNGTIFYLKPDLELYRPCDNPRCGRYFLVKTTSTRNRFCSQECCNRVTQDRYRKREKEGL